MSTPLTKPAVREMAVETSVVDLLQEFLARYFDGGTHDVGLNEAVQFNHPELLFQQSGATAPALAITLVWSEPGKKWVAWETFNGRRQQVVQTRVNWNFWVRATGKNASKAAKQTGDLLYGLLNNSAETHLLGQKGILRVRPLESRAVQDTDYVVRLITCSAQLRYRVLSQLLSAGEASLPLPNRVYSGAAEPEGVQVGNVGDEYNQIVDGVFIAEWIKVAGNNSTTGWS